MATASVFDLAAQELERHTPLDRLQARGTLRIVVRDSGLDARTVTGPALAHTIAAALPKELTLRGIEQAETICRSICDLLRKAQDA